MQAKDLLAHNLKLSDTIFNGLLADLTDADLLVRTAPAANHTAWQLGHLIESERKFVNDVCPGGSPPLPEGFAAAHSKEAAKSDSPGGFLKKDQYVALYQKQRAATLAALEKLSADDLDKPGPESIRSFVPLVGHCFALMSEHQMWHIGQITSLRRQLNKPVLF